MKRENGAIVIKVYHAQVSLIFCPTWSVEWALTPPINLKTLSHWRLTRSSHMGGCKICRSSK